MKLFKEIFFKLILFIILGLTYYIFTMKSYFNDIFGFISFGLTFILVELIYYYINKKTKFFDKKISLIILFIIAFIFILLSTFCIVDYYRVTNGKDPIFTNDTVEEEVIFITYSEAGDMREEKGVAITEHIGIGYSILVCNENVTCDKPVIVHPFGVGSFSYSFTGRDITELD